MPKSVRELQKEMYDKKEEIKELVSQNRIEEAKNAKTELIMMQGELNSAYEHRGENLMGKISMDNLIPIDKKKTLNQKKIIFNKNDKLVDYVSGEENNSIDLGKYIRGAITGNWQNAEVELDTFKAMTTGTGKILIPEFLSAEIIDLARNKSLIFNGGVPLVKMDSNNMTIGKVKSDPVFGFKTEGEKAEVSEMSFEGVELKSKTAYGLMKVSLELLHSAENLESILRNSISQSVADMIDKACLYGSGVNEPNGVLNNTEINVIEATNLGYNDYVKAVGAMGGVGAQPCCFCYRRFVGTFGFGKDFGTTVSVHVRHDVSTPNGACDVAGTAVPCFAN